MTDTPSQILETKRLLLRPLTMDDIDALFALYSDADVKRYVYSEAMTHEETREELEWIIQIYTDQPGFGLWATVHKETGEFIGRCGLLPWTIEGRPEVEVTYMLAKKYWGQGLGTEVAQALVEYGFAQLNCSRLICCIDQDNQASMSVAKNLGMTFERKVDTGEGPELLYSLDVLGK